ncbi:MerR family transcriptional regulator [Nocardioides sp. GY 10113]|uniref:MerR family transcriptional regulator n=1 Tax=Nocardioides sp. GY 10113 TaxID=2569761 RepID=UPI0010A831D8|nr:helix-turn-helix domain-containing protein [Nocardioides sp. GY 10113]TIC88866.1 MerR family transcriptional regulator [Nocardioides sp. GY 10113]
MSTSAEPAAAAGQDLTLAELERATGVAARTIRYYQSEGLLPRPTRRGGKAMYGDRHLERLRTIASLQSQGLRLQTIRQVLGESGEPASEVVDLLGPALTGTAWLATSAQTLDEGELADLLGDCYPEQVPALVSTGYLERRTQPDGRKVWYAPSVPQLRGALEMFSLGTDFALSRWSADQMRARLRELSELFVARWIAESGALYEGEGSTADFTRHLEQFRAVAWQSAAHVMAEEIGAAMGRADEIRARLEAGAISDEDLGRAPAQD